MRHHPFHSRLYERDLWLKHMRAALDSLELDPELDRPLWAYLEMAAHSMINAPG
jgi:hemoglobin